MPFVFIFFQTDQNNGTFYLLYISKILPVLMLLPTPVHPSTQREWEKGQKKILVSHIPPFPLE